MEKPNEFEILAEELPRPRRKAAEIMVVPQASSGTTRAERLRTGARRWVTSRKAKPDLRRFTRALPML